MVTVLGVDGCRAGWVGVRWADGVEPTTRVAATIGDLVTLEGGPGALDVVAIDIPMRLPTSGPREAERRARARLRGRASTVFNSPAASAVDAATYDEANRLNREALGLGLSRQSFGLFPAIRDVRDWLATGPDVLVREVHPELSFATLAGVVLAERKTTVEGASRRRALLADVGLHLPAVAPRGAGLDDLLDAGVAAWSARRIASGEAECVPEHTDDGSAIWA